MENEENEKMENLEKAYKKIIEDMEERIKDNEDLEYAKEELLKLMILFFTEMEHIKNHYNEKINKILERQVYFDEKLNKVEELAKSIEEEMILNEEVEDQMMTELLHPSLKNYENELDAECEVTCPYCGELFFIHIEGAEKEITCPYCDNPIELDWNDSSDNDRKSNDDDM